MADNDHTLTQERSSGEPEAGGPSTGPAAAGTPERHGKDGASAPSAAAVKQHAAKQHGKPQHEQPEHEPAEHELAGDLDELVRTAAQRDEYLALAQRTQADFENYRKRVARDAQAAQERGTTALARELLPALDNLDRALGAAAADDPLLDGVRLVRAELSAALSRAGIESFSPLGEPFDPSVHEAMATAEQPPEGSDSGTVVEVYQPGYRLGSSVIRPARVVVAA